MVKIIAGLFLLSCSFAGLAQQTRPLRNTDSRTSSDAIVKDQLKYLDSLYIYSTGALSEVINGRDYIRYFFRSPDKPLLRAEEERTGSLIFRGRRYDDLPLQYDTYTGEIIYNDSKLILNNKICEVALNSDNISRFDLYFRHDTITFKYFRNEPDSPFDLQEGFYEAVHDGECKYIIRHVSALIFTDGVEKYPYTPESYIRIADRYVRTGTRKEFIKLFGYRSDAIRQYMHREKIRLRNADKYQITDILKFYERLNAQAG